MTNETLNDYITDPTLMTMGDVLDQIVKDADLENRRDARHKRRGTIPKFRKRLFLARIKNKL
jgi:hypothetical protein